MSPFKSIPVATIDAVFTVPAKVETPETTKVFALTSAVETPDDTVTIPACIGVTLRPSPKSIVPAVPTVEVLSNTTIPEPEPTTLVNPAPSQIKLDAVTDPLILIFPVPVIFLLNKSKLPPS